MYFIYSDTNNKNTHTQTQFCFNRPCCPLTHKLCCDPKSQTTSVCRQAGGLNIIEAKELKPPTLCLSVLFFENFISMIVTVAA